MIFIDRFDDSLVTGPDSDIAAEILLILGNNGLAGMR
jgi:hypothetical protein